MLSLKRKQGPHGGPTHRAHAYDSLMTPTATRSRLGASIVRTEGSAVDST